MHINQILWPYQHFSSMGLSPIHLHDRYIIVQSILYRIDKAQKMRPIEVRILLAEVPD